MKYKGVREFTIFVKEESIYDYYVFVQEFPNQFLYIGHQQKQDCVAPVAILAASFCILSSSVFSCGLQ